MLDRLSRWQRKEGLWDGVGIEVSGGVVLLDDGEAGGWTG